MTDIFEFWSQIGHGETIHPADKKVFARTSNKNNFQTENCLPASYYGPLRTAPVVLLFLSPGYCKEDEIDAQSNEGKDHYFKRWKGNEPFRNDPSTPGYSWIKKITKDFGDFEKIRNKIAILNIGAYHSKNIKCYASLLALPSSRISLNWAHNTLFPQAESGEKIVVCLRSAAYWGLQRGIQYGDSLYSPYASISGHLYKNSENEILKEKIRNKLK